MFERCENVKIYKINFPQTIFGSTHKIRYIYRKRIKRKSAHIFAKITFLMTSRPPNVKIFFLMDDT